MSKHTDLFGGNPVPQVPDVLDGEAEAAAFAQLEKDRNKQGGGNVPIMLVLGAFLGIILIVSGDDIIAYLKSLW